jgi:hypothetical protein
MSEGGSGAGGGSGVGMGVAGDYGYGGLNGYGGYGNGYGAGGVGQDIGGVSHNYGGSFTGSAPPDASGSFSRSLPPSVHALAPMVFPGQYPIALDPLASYSGQTLGSGPYGSTHSKDALGYATSAGVKGDYLGGNVAAPAGNMGTGARGGLRGGGGTDSFSGGEPGSDSLGGGGGGSGSGSTSSGSGSASGSASDSGAAGRGGSGAGMGTDSSGESTWAQTWAQNQLPLGDIMRSMFERNFVPSRPKTAGASSKTAPPRHSEPMPLPARTRQSRRGTQGRQSPQAPPRIGTRTQREMGDMLGEVLARLAQFAQERGTR